MCPYNLPICTISCTSLACSGQVCTDTVRIWTKYIIRGEIALLITYICMHTPYILYRPAYITYIHLSVSSMHANILHMPRPLSLLWPASGNYLPTRNSWKWPNHHLISTIVVKSALLCIESCFYIQVLLRRSHTIVTWVLTIVVPYVGVLNNICDICRHFVDICHEPQMKNVMSCQWHLPEIWEHMT